MYIPRVALETSFVSGEHTFLQAVLDPSGLPKRGVDPFRQERVSGIGLLWMLVHLLSPAPKNGGDHAEALNT